MYILYDHTYYESMDQPGKVASLARGQLNRENEHFPGKILGWLLNYIVLSFCALLIREESRE